MSPTIALESSLAARRGVEVCDSPFGGARFATRLSAGLDCPEVAAGPGTTPGDPRRTHSERRKFQLGTGRGSGNSCGLGSRRAIAEGSGEPSGPSNVKQGKQSRAKQKQGKAKTKQISGGGVRGKSWLFGIAGS
jgi:hypothetical protein